MSYEAGAGSRPAIAIVGMACVFPGAHSPEELWENVLAGRRAFRKIPPERMPAEDYYSPDPAAPGKTYCDQAALITDWVFDPLDFGIPPVVERASDIVHWLALHTAHRAVLDARLDLKLIDRTRVGVILGNTLVGEFTRSHSLRFRWPYVARALRRVLRHQGLDEVVVEGLTAAVRIQYESPLPEITEDTLAGNMSNTIVGRICNYFDLGGCGYTVDGACSSSLLAVAHACSALERGELDYALAGGVDVSLDPFEIVGFAKTRALAEEDIRPYDERASGLLAGEGCGVFVLARAEDARAAGLRIHALVTGWGYSADGAGGITSPEASGQMRALERAYARAGYPISSVGLFEGHGTGTALGDRVEVLALRAMLENSPLGRTFRIGSIKGNIGHCKAAAGAAGMIKAVMALSRKIIPPSVNCDRPNAAFGTPPSRLIPAVRGAAWEASEVPRRASVSSMGFGGANSHITIEEADPAGSPLVKDLALLASAQATELLLFADDERDGLRVRLSEIAAAAGGISRAELTDLAAALAVARPAGRLRVAIVADSPWALARAAGRCRDALDAGAAIDALDAPEQGILAGTSRPAPTLLALFPGQGSQRIEMGALFRRRHIFLRALYDEADTFLADLLPGGLSAAIFAEEALFDAAEIRARDGRLRETRLAQPAILLSSLAALQLLRHFGLVPDFALGHSLGEITALHAAGACDENTALRLAALRGRAMSALAPADPGEMAAVAERSFVIRALLDAFDGELVISNYNSPRQTVVSGSTKAVRAFQEACTARRLRCSLLPVSHAFHSPLVAPAASAFSRDLREAQFSAPGRHVFSTTLGGLLPRDADLPALLAGQIVGPVRFHEAVQAAAAHAPDLWVEVGPGAVLSRFVGDILGENAVRCLPIDPGGQESSRPLNELLGRAFVLGFPVRVERLFDGRFFRPFPLGEYRPAYIVNPCERPAAPLAEISAAAGGRGMLDELLPQGTDHEEFERYLRGRLAFLREFVAMDFRSAGGGLQQGIVPATAADIPAAAVEPAAEERPPGAGSDVPDRDGILAFAVDWIARRTGFPAESITPEKRLRDDLNLDSIKVGELAIVLTRKFRLRLPLDHDALMNVPLSELVGQLVLPLSATQEADGAETDDLAPEGNIPDSVRTYSLAYHPVGIEAEAALPLPGTGEILLVAPRGSVKAKTLAGRLRVRGGTVRIVDPARLVAARDIELDLVGLVLFLPSRSCVFSEEEEGGFEARLEGFAAELFRTFQWADRHRRGDWRGMRSLVLRDNDGPGDLAADLDAGAGFLKTLSLEHPEASFKWLSLPASWELAPWAEVVLRELETGGMRVSYRYDEAGMRRCELAHPEHPAAAAPPPLDPGDTVIVTGGARGITCELALELHRLTGVKLALLGSSPPPGDAEGPAADELRRNLRRFEQAGARFLYLQCDVTDAAAVREAVRQADLGLGPATAILHGAGVSQLALFSKMDVAAGVRNIRVKARGLYHLLRAVPPRQLKAVHLLTSVLGTTGMKGQADYTFANAWLVGALRSLRASYPHLHCLALGYSVWAETGLGRRLGTVESLTSLGIHPISNAEGVDAYRRLLLGATEGPAYVIAGRMTPELEAQMFPPARPPAGRFLERLLRWIPGGEIVANAVLSHEEDLYLAEHVYQGTVLFPAVMAMEAMVEAAQACLGTDELPVVRSVRIRRPLIVPEDERVVLRVMAVADPPHEGRVKVKVALHADRDGFRANHFRCDCYFGAGEPSVATPECPVALSLLDLDPEDFSPRPLFQGKFFRRITALHQFGPGVVLARVTVPDGERYFHTRPGSLSTGSPAARDAFLQVGGLALPAGYLPVQFGEIRFHARLRPGAELLCQVRGETLPDGRFGAEIHVWDAVTGAPVESILGIVLEAPVAAAAAAAAPAPTPPSLLDHLPGELRALLPETPFSLVFVRQGRPEALLAAGDLHTADLEEVRIRVGAPRLSSALGNLVAARRAAAAFARSCGVELHPNSIGLDHNRDGRLSLRFEKPEIAALFAGMEISLADAGEISAALLAPVPAGIDLEPVARRDAETWIGLLGEAGYRAAREMAARLGESFDTCATRIWTLRETAWKGGAPTGEMPDSEVPISGRWCAHTAQSGTRNRDFFSVVCAPTDAAGARYVLALTLDTVTRPATAGRKGAPATPPVPPVKVPLRETAVAERFRSFAEGFFGWLRQAQTECAEDPGLPDTERRYQEFQARLAEAVREMRSLESAAAPGSIPRLQRQISAGFGSLLAGSTPFRRAIEKPFGYPGDHLLMEQMLFGESISRGLAYHLDRSFLAYPGSEAVRQRTHWVVERLFDLASRHRLQTLKLLDLGCGPLAIERMLLERLEPATGLEVTGLDFDPRAIEFAATRLAGSRARLHLRQVNLVSPGGVAYVAHEAAGCHAAVCMGLIEYLDDETTCAIYEALFRGLPAGARLFSSNYRPDHPAQPTMEWLLDWRLTYRTVEDLRRVVESAGFRPENVRTDVDPTGCIVLLEAER